MRWFALAAVALVLLAGCSTPERPSPGSGFPAQRVELAVPESQNFTGIHVSGIVEGEGAALTLTASAHNAGPKTYSVETGCSEPWRELLLHDGEQVQMRAPIFRCLAFGLRDFPPGETIPLNLVWNGTVWNDDVQGYVQADAGSYYWSTQFIAYLPGGNTLKRFDLDFPVTVT